KCTNRYDPDTNDQRCSNTSHDDTDSKRKFNHPQQLKTCHTRRIGCFHHCLVDISHTNIRILRDGQNRIQHQCDDCSIRSKTHDNHHNSHCPERRDCLDDTSKCQDPPTLPYYEIKIPSETEIMDANNTPYTAIRKCL